MTLIGKNDPWPEEIRMDYSAGMRRPMPRQFRDIVVDGICKWVSDHGERPTHIVVGRAFEPKIVTEQSYMYRPFLSDGTNEYMGMSLIIAKDCGIEILTG
jgi:hypothetical protein